MSTAAEQDSPASTLSDEAVGVGTPDAVEGQADTQGDGVDAEPESVSRREARYRVEAKEAKQEVERLTGVVESLQRASVESIVDGAVPSKALWSTVQLTDVVDDAGVPDASKVRAAVEQTKVEFDLGAQRPEPNPFLGQSGAGGRDAATAFADSFAPRR